MNDIDRACAAFRTLLTEQQARVAGMTAERVDYTKKATVTIGLVDGDGIGPIIMEQAVRVLEVLLADEIAAASPCGASAASRSKTGWPAIRPCRTMCSMRS